METQPDVEKWPPEPDGLLTYEDIMTTIVTELQASGQVTPLQMLALFRRRTKLEMRHSVEFLKDYCARHNIDIDLEIMAAKRRPRLPRPVFWFTIVLNLITFYYLLTDLRYRIDTATHISRNVVLIYVLLNACYVFVVCILVLVCYVNAVGFVKRLWNRARKRAA